MESQKKKALTEQWSPFTLNVFLFFQSEIRVYLRDSRAVDCIVTAKALRP